MNSDEIIKREVNELPLLDLCDELEFRGIKVERASQRAMQEPLLKRLILDEFTSSSSPFTWTLVSRKYHVHFFSEVIMIPWDDDILFIGPHFPSVRDKPVVIVTALNIKSCAWRTVQTIGKVVNPFMVFKRMPIYWIDQGSFYMSYADVENKKYAVDCLNLKTGVWAEVVTTGAQPPIREYVDGAFYKGSLYVAGCIENITHKLNFASGEWSVIRTTGAHMAFPNGSSILHKNNLHNFSVDGTEFFSLDLDTLHWTRTVTPKILDFNARRHSHLILVYEDQLLLIRASDSFQLNSFDLSTKQWNVIDTVGKRPNNVKTEASMVIVDHAIYCLGGQKTRNHIVSIKLKDTHPQRGQPLSIIKELPLPQMFSDGFQDVVFVLGSDAISAHKCILASRSPYFKTMFLKCGKEIAVSGIEFEYFRLLILFFYDRLDLSQCMYLDQLFKVAFIYQAVELQSAIISFLFQNVTPESSVHLLRMLFSLEATEGIAKYKKQVFDYMIQHSRSLSQHPVFLDFCKENPIAVAEFFEVMNQTADLRPGKQIVVCEQPPSTNKIKEFWFVVDAFVQ